MDNAFRAKVRAAAVAGWWTLLFALAFLVIQWLGYRLVMSAKPGWVLSLWGPGATWDSIGPVWFQALLILKLGLWPIAVAALWLTLWARHLRVGPPNS
jgi:hypothetical protein